VIETEKNMAAAKIPQQLIADSLDKIRGHIAELKDSLAKWTSLKESIESLRNMYELPLSCYSFLFIFLFFIKCSHFP
jgi:hypothetical protein